MWKEVAVSRKCVRRMKVAALIGGILIFSKVSLRILSISLQNTCSDDSLSSSTKDTLRVLRRVMRADRCMVVLFWVIRSQEYIVLVLLRSILRYSNSTLTLSVSNYSFH